MLVPSESESESESRLFLISFRISSAGREMAFGKTLLCVPSVANTAEEMASDMASAAAMGADVVELRLDCLSSFQPRSDLDRLLTNRPIPALVTYRPQWEGGEYDGHDETRIEALLLAMELGADYVDIEFKVAARLLNLMSGRKPQNLKLIISSHNYEMTPSVEELGNLAASIQTLGADIVKSPQQRTIYLMYPECSN